MTNVTLAIVHDTRRALDSGRYPVRLRVTFKLKEGLRSHWIQKYYGDNLSLTIKEFATYSVPRSEEVRAVKRELSVFETKAKSIVSSNDYLTPELFESLFYGVALDTVNGMFDKAIEEFKARDQVGTARVYRTAINSLSGLTPLGEWKILRFSEITPEWLEEYERDSIKAGRSVNYVSINLRCLRAIYNKAKKLKIIPPALYPFDDYKVRSESKFKIPLSEREIDAVKAYKPKNQLQAYAKDFFMFSYYCNGINLNDVCKLRRSDIVDEFIVYHRSKTRNTSRQLKKIIVPLDHNLERIIKRRGAPSLDPGGYIFPILDEGLSAKTIKGRVTRFNKKVNEGIKEIAGELKIKKKLTSVIARHTFANRMMNGGVDRRIISESLGHSQAQTTEHYLGSMDLDKIKKARRSL